MFSGDAARAAEPVVGFAVVDVEASGASSRRHRIVELAVVQLDRDRRVQAEFATLVDPEGPVGPTHIHGIEPGDLVPAPRFAQVAHRLAGLLRGRVLVGHNVGCDRAFLAAEYARLGVVMPVVPQVCTMRLAERFFGFPHGRSLRACAAVAGVPGWCEHTALGDARTAGELFARCAGRVVRGAPAGRDAGPGPAAGCGEQLALAAAVRWPRVPGRTGARGAAWVARSRPRVVREAVGVRYTAGSARCPGGA